MKGPASPFRVRVPEPTPGWFTRPQEDDFPSTSHGWAESQSQPTVSFLPRTIFDIIAVVDLGCWLICFWWMHRISSRQDAVLRQLQKQARRIEEISKAEHDILTEVHPSVQQIEKDLNQVTEKVSPVDR